MHAPFLTVARYIERNSLRAGLVPAAQQWRWSGLWRRMGQGGKSRRVHLPLAIWPVAQPLDWLTWINQPPIQTELDAIRLSVSRGRPYGAQ